MTRTELQVDVEPLAANDLVEVRRRLDAAHAADDYPTIERLLHEALALGLSQPDRADHLSELAWAYEQLGRFDDAVDKMREAVATGLRDKDVPDYPGAASLIAELLLRAGRTEEAHDAFAQALASNPSDPRIHLHAGEIYGGAGLPEEAWQWLTSGLELALAGDDTYIVWLLAGERGGDDELQERAQELLDREKRQEAEQARRLQRGKRAMGALGVGWHPAPEYERALAILPRFAADNERAPYAAYCARLESVLRDVSGKRIADRVGLVEVVVDDYLAWCAARDLDPNGSTTRADYATDLVERGLMRPWPPSRNEPCWCESGRKYKKCCGKT
jgi:tetratricopeptide (TPR) repeat protein